MRIIALKTLREFWETHPNARQPLQAWYEDVRCALWNSPADIKAVYRNASIIANNRVIFNIKGNDNRLIVAINYRFGIAYVRFVGTHGDYDRIDATTV
jgi:mRNA interferase HigB